MLFYLQLTEYIVLRLIRRFLFPYSLLLRIGKYIPYFRVNANQDGARDIVDEYERLIREHATGVLERPNLRILEIGAGVTDTVGLLLSERFGCHVHVCDPYVRYDEAGTRDGIQRFKISMEAQSRTQRVLEPLSAGYDLILSNSVLEHVEDPEGFFRQMKGALREGGVMIHRVDYRDHFFKYPYFFLMFSDQVWNTFLNPGDLYRWRLDDHLEAAERAGVGVRSSSEVVLEEGYERIRHRTHDRFGSYKRCNVATANLVVR
ncbi:MAG: methyltransferase domain-containing protein [Candidatus Kapabacteria bacterium]|nr:methyltransferase domain-containing protein [Candidatus Kapabacteria bacterium]